jgi:hypothetical protein
MSFSHVAVLTIVTGLAATSSGLKAQQLDAGSSPQNCKVCMSEPKPNSRTVYVCKKEEYCLPRCDVFSLLSRQGGCAEGSCGNLKVRHRLVVKKVPDCDTKQCVPRYLPVGGSSECAPPGHSR